MVALSRSYVLNFTQQPSQLDLDESYRFSLIPPKAPITHFAKLAQFSDGKIKDLESIVTEIVWMCRTRGGWFPFRMSFLIASIRERIKWSQLEHNDSKLYALLILWQGLHDLANLGLLEWDRGYYRISSDFIELVSHQQLAA